MTERSLFKLLRIDSDNDRQKIDANAIIKEAQQNPHDVDLVYSFFRGWCYRCCPLHQAILLGLGVEVINALSSPVSIRQKSCGATALYLACQQEASFNVIYALLSKWPDAAKEKDIGGRTPLHFVCQYSAPSDAFRLICLLLSSWPDGVKEKDANGCLPLHLACHYGAPFDAIRVLLSSWPDAAKEKVRGGLTPLHLACRKGASIDVVDALLRSWPDAAKEKNNERSTPLHLACCNRASSPDVVHALLRSWPDAAKKKAKGGLTPLHIACRKGASIGVVDALLLIWPDAAKEKVKFGLTPLHLACDSRPSIDVINALLTSWPYAAKEKDNKGYVPLYYACHCGASLAVVQSLLDLWLEAAENRNMHSVESLIAKNTLRDVKDLFFHISSLFNENQSNPSPYEVMSFFIGTNWWNGAFLVIDEYPAVIKTLGLHIKVMADYLSAVGKCCSLTTMFKVIQNEPELLEGV